MKKTLNEEVEGNKEREVSSALIAVHPLEQSVAVAIGSELRVFNLQRDCAVTLVDDSGGPLHSDSIRAISYGANGTLFASAGDDKLVKIWTMDTWRCVRTVNVMTVNSMMCIFGGSEKRVSALAISHDGLFVTFADKFGVVWVVALKEESGRNDNATPILAHYCSIITSLEFSPDGRFIVSADRDFKIRRPANGAHEIQSFCLGHTEFVSCLSFISTAEHPQGFLLSGSGDSTVRLWDVISGSLLDTCEVGMEVGLLEANGTEEVCPAAVTGICASPDGSLVAVAIQSLNGVMLLRFYHSSRKLFVSKVVSMMENFIPTSLAMSSIAEHLWMVTGASNLFDFGSQSLTRVKVVSGIKNNGSDPTGAGPVVLEDNDIPGGSKLLEKLQGRASISKEDKLLAATAEAVKIAMRNLLIKRQYSVEKRELRKKSRNDRKLKQVD